MILYKYKTVDHIEDIIVNQRLFCSKFDMLNDPMEWAFTSSHDRYEIEQLINDTQKDSWRICCLSESEQYGLMWSMYADSHKGVCVEVEVEIQNSIEEGNIYEYRDEWLYGKIVYASSAKKLVNLSRNEIYSVLFKKSKQWEQEQEIRFIRRKKEDENIVYFPVKVNKIYLGKRIDADKACYIEKLCKLANIRCIKMDSFAAPKINYWRVIKNKIRKNSNG